MNWIECTLNITIQSIDRLTLESKYLVNVNTSNLGL